MSFGGTAREATQGTPESLSDVETVKSHVRAWAWKQYGLRIYLDDSSLHSSIMYVEESPAYTARISRRFPSTPSKKKALTIFRSEIQVGRPDEIFDAKLIAARIADPSDGGIANLLYHDLLAYNFISGLVLHAAYASESSPLSVGTFRSLCTREVEALITTVRSALHDPVFEQGWVTSDFRPTQTHPYITKVMDEMMQLPLTDFIAAIAVTEKQLQRFRSRNDTSM